MITLIGTSNSVIGFGLCGVKDIHEVTRRTSPEEILNIITSSKNEIIMIDEEIYLKIQHKLKELKHEKQFIKIPWRFKPKEKDDNINELIKDITGVEVKNE